MAKPASVFIGRGAPSIASGDTMPNKARAKLSGWPLRFLVGLLLLAGGFGLSFVSWGEWVQTLRTFFEALGAVGFLAFGAAYVVAAVLLIPVWPLSITGGLVFGGWGFVLVPVSATLGPQPPF
jgi:uncharacterized membrane protein YdjX (TVP38/TMEM64 family)